MKNKEHEKAVHNDRNVNVQKKVKHYYKKINK